MFVSRSIGAKLVVLGLAALAASCGGEEKGKGKAAPPRQAQTEKPREEAGQKARARAEAKAEAKAKEKEKDKDKERVVKRVATAQGPLQIVRRGEPAEYSVVLGDRTLVKPKERVIEVASVGSAKGSAKLVLLRFPGKDKDCPALFRVVEVPKGKDPRTSDEFGNCSSKAHASAAASGWKISFPKTKSAPAKAWVYADGDVRELEAKAKKG